MSSVYLLCCLPQMVTSTILLLILNVDSERRSGLAEGEMRNAQVSQTTATKRNGMEEKPRVQSGLPSGNKSKMLVL